MIAGPPELMPEIEEALERHRLKARRMLLISPLQERKGTRFAYRVETEDGRTVKVRHLGTSEDARRLFELRAGLEEAFAPALGRYGPVLIEEWIEGVELTAGDAEARAEEAGALLGRLHASPLGPEVPATCSTRQWRDGAESDLKILGDAAKLTPGEVASLRAQILRHDPGMARAALIHKDFCAENMLIDACGRLRVIDNERLAIEAAGFDLGWTFHRWPMPEAAWLRFRRGYRAAAGVEPESIGFWMIAATLVCARVFLERMPVRLDGALVRLRHLIAGEGLSSLPPV